MYVDLDTGCPKRETRAPSITRRTTSNRDCSPCTIDNDARVGASWGHAGSNHGERCTRRRNNRLPLSLSLSLFMVYTACPRLLLPLPATLCAERCFVSSLKTGPLASRLSLTIKKHTHTNSRNSLSPRVPCQVLRYVNPCSRRHESETVSGLSSRAVYPLSCG